MGISSRAVAVGIPSSGRQAAGGPDIPVSISTSKFHVVPRASTVSRRLHCSPGDFLRTDLLSSKPCFVPTRCSSDDASRPHPATTDSSVRQLGCSMYLSLTVVSTHRDLTSLTFIRRAQPVSRIDLSGGMSVSLTQEYSCRSFICWISRSSPALTLLAGGSSIKAPSQLARTTMSAFGQASSLTSNFNSLFPRMWRTFLATLAFFDRFSLLAGSRGRDVACVLLDTVHVNPVLRVPGIIRRGLRLWIR